MARTRDNAPDTAPEAVSGDLADLEIESVEWESQSAGRPLHPQLVKALEHSWANRVVNGNVIKTPASKVTARSIDEAKLRERQLRDAGASLGVGVGIRQRDNGDGTFTIHFRARKRRGSGDVTA